MLTSETITKLAPALLAAQKEIGAAKMDAVNPFFKSKYADLGSVMAVCKDALNKNKLVVLQPINGGCVETVIIHESGEWILGLTQIVTSKPNDPQAQGAAITYARRYGLQSMLFIPAEDDDGESASQSRPRTTATSPTTATQGTSSQGGIAPTPKQISMIMSLLDQKGYLKEDLYVKYKVNSLRELSLVTASTIIDNLMKLPDVGDIQ